MLELVSLQFRWRLDDLIELFQRFRQQSEIILIRLISHFMVTNFGRLLTVYSLIFDQLFGYLGDRGVGFGDFSL